MAVTNQEKAKAKANEILYYKCSDFPFRFHIFAHSKELSKWWFYILHQEPQWYKVKNARIWESLLESRIMYSRGSGKLTALVLTGTEGPKIEEEIS